MSLPHKLVYKGKSYTKKLLHQVLPDWLSSRYGGGVREMGFTKDGEPRNSIPMVFRLGDKDNTNNGHYVFLNKEWQFFTFDLLCLSYYGKTHNELTAPEYDWIANRWKGLYEGSTAFTNNQGTDTNRNYITKNPDDMNLGAKKGIGLYTLVCGFACLEGEVDGGVLKAATFDGTKPPPNIKTINIKGDPRIFFANIITNKPIESGYIVRKFTYLENPITKVLYNCPIPIISNKPVYYPIKDLKTVDFRTYAYYPEEK